MNISDIKNFNQQFPSDSLRKYQSFRNKMFHPKSDSPLLGKNLDSLKVRYGNIEDTIVKRIFRDYLHEDITSVKKIETKSTFHILFTVKCLKEIYVLKINISEQVSDFTFYIEAYMQRLLASINLPSVPIIYDISRENFPFDFMIMPFVKEGDLGTYRGGNRYDIYQELGKIFKQFHNVRVENAGTIRVEDLCFNNIKGSFTNWVDFFQLHLQDHIDKVSSLGLIRAYEKKNIENFFKTNRCFVYPKRLALLHNDPGPRNIRTDGKAITAILDWEDMIVGDPLWEIAFFNTFNYGKKFQENFKYFCRGYELQVDELYRMPKYWMYYLRVILLKAISKSSEKEYDPTLDKSRIRDAISYIKNLQ